MTRTQKTILLLSCFALVSVILYAEPVEIARHQEEHSSAQIVGVRVDGTPAIALKFSGTDDLHYYADPATAPAPGLELMAAGSADGVRFGPTRYPQEAMFLDPSLGKEIEVYAEEFAVVLPIESHEGGVRTVTVELTGIACTSKLCLPPFERELTAEIDFSDAEMWPAIGFSEGRRAAAATEPRAVTAAVQPAASAVEVVLMLLLAVLAGMAFNVMPCVLPVLPLIASRMINIAKENPRRRIALGLTFCVGIIAFFAAVGVFSSVVRLTTGAVFNLSDPYRYPTFNIVMAVFLVVFAMFMFDVLPLTLPSKVSGKSSDASTFGGSFGMGFLAAILSIPCSGAILAAVLIWVQAQHWLMGFWVFVLMGIGMALPYAALVLAPSLLSKIPKPGHWMDMFKKAMGFAILLLAIKPMSGLPKERMLDVATFAVIVAFAAWMWGTWVSYSASAGKKWLVRGAAVLLAVVSGFWLLPEKLDIIDWYDYDRGLIQTAVAEERPVLVKFTADWCTNCKILESRVFFDPEVAEFLKANNVLPVKADTTLADFAASKDLQAIYGVPGTVPMTILHLPWKDEPVRLSGIYDKQELFEAIERDD